MLNVLGGFDVSVSRVLQFPAEIIYNEMLLVFRNSELGCIFHALDRLQPATQTTYFGHFICASFISRELGVNSSEQF